MYDQTTIDQCLKLRAEGKSYRRIAEELNVAPATAIKWVADHKAIVQQLRGERLEALHEQYLGNYEDKLSDIAREVAAIDTELKLRDFGDVSTEFLLYRKTSLQARLEKLAAREFQTIDPGLQPQELEQN